MATFADLKSTLDSSVAVNASDAKTLALATSAKAASDAEVSTDTVAFASAIKSAPGGFVVDPSGPVVLYSSPDGLTFSAVTIAGFGDAVPVPAPAPVDPPAPPAQS